MTEWDLQPIVKYEFFDPDTELDKADISYSTQGNQAITSMTFGFNYFFNEWTRLQVNYINHDEEYLDVDNDELQIQLQVKF